MGTEAFLQPVPESWPCCMTQATTSNRLLLTKSVYEILMQKLGLLAYPRYTIILACAPNLAKMALDVTRGVDTLYPCSFTVSEEDGRVHVAHLSIMKVAAAIGLAADAALAPVNHETKKRVAAAWNRL